MTIVAVVIYDRFENLERWVKVCADYPLVIIHNDNGDSDKYRKYCLENGVKYFRRKNIGFDIGAFQDVCKRRIKGFPEWDNMLWCTDDTIPVKKNFVDLFLSKLKTHTTPCMEISREVTPHVRTTGFMITRDIADKLVFPAEAITTKDQCYHFEHRGGRQTLFHQLSRMGKRPSMVSALPASPLWDTGNARHLRMNRWGEFQAVFGAENLSSKVTVICPIYNSYPDIIGCMISQTHKDWELLLVHDGPNETGIEKVVKAANDKRIKYWETKERVGNWGHKIRRDVLAGLKDEDTGYVLIGNPDNHIVPTFLEYMLNPMLGNNNILATFCSDMVHSYKNWQVIPCSLKRGFVDCMGVLVRKEIACDVGFAEVEHHSADYFYFESIIKKYGAHTFAKVNGCLLVHN